MKYLFYFIHPAKFHSFKRTINYLKTRGHDVDVFINSKDILEELIKEEGWDYKNLFPKGRRIKGLHTYLNAAVNSFVTVYRLLKNIHGKRYDLFITDDLLTIVGRIRRTPSIFFTDDDISAVPESVLLISTTNYVLAPSVSNMGRYEFKKIGYEGYKSLAHLHPNTFIPQKNKIDISIDQSKPIFFIRTVLATSTHDVGKKGLTDKILIDIVNYLKEKGQIIISTQRKIPKEFKKYVLDFPKQDVAHYIYYSSLFISDSTTMCAEAAVLGTFAIEIDDWFADFKQYEEFNQKYKLINGYSSNEKQAILGKISEIVELQDEIKVESTKLRSEILKDKIDVSGFMIWLFENYPNSVEEFFLNPDFQKRFK